MPRKLEGFYLIQIIRNGETIAPIRLEDVIRSNDELVFTGTLNSLEKLEKLDNLLIKQVQMYLLILYKQGMQN